jgi:DNA repair protein RadC
MKNQLTIGLREVELLYSPEKDLINRTAISSSSAAHEYLRQAYNQKTIGCQEEFIVLMLNQANKPIGFYRAGKGGINSTIADVRLVLAAALKSVATGIIISHNHPSGNLKESESDRKLTRTFKESCSIMEIAFLDHLILDPFGNYMSFADEGKL